MLGLGIYDLKEYMDMGPERRFAGPRVAYNLLSLGENPSPEEIRVFEDISVTLRTSNGTFRTTYRNRFENLDEQCNALLTSLFPPDAALRIEDRAVSHGLTSCEWARRLLPVFPGAQIEASDLVLQLLELTVDGVGTFVTEADGTPLQFINPPYVVSLYHPESLRNPIRCWVAARARRQFRQLGLPDDWTRSRMPGFEVRAIPFVHPEAAALARTDPRFFIRRRSVFESGPPLVDVVRTMNIFNRDYFSDERLAEGFRAVFNSVRPDGIWIAGRSLEEDLSNHSTFFKRIERGWSVVERIGGGWDLEGLALGSCR